MKRLQIILKSGLILAVFFTLSCRSKEKARLDRFLGEWGFESNCTTGPPFRATTLALPKTVTVTKAKPDGIRFDEPGCGETDRGTNLFLTYDDKKKSYILYASDNNSILRSYHFGNWDEGIPLSYSEETGFNNDNKNGNISIQWEGDKHCIWSFSYKEKDSEYFVHIMHFRK